MDSNYRAWAKANPTLAKKVKKGQAGYKAINSGSSKSSGGSSTPAKKSRYSGSATFPSGRTSTNKSRTGTKSNPMSRTRTKADTFNPSAPKIKTKAKPAAKASRYNGSTSFPTKSPRLTKNKMTVGTKSNPFKKKRK
jgi:hypothetical protein